ncbi:MAG: hypothetical protein K1Y36_06780 [Blastocatellia bacterium]|nr:hypothetical protein [Blastocatellia bacterium]
MPILDIRNVLVLSSCLHHAKAKTTMARKTGLDPARISRQTAGVEQSFLDILQGTVQALGEVDPHQVETLKSRIDQIFADRHQSAHPLSASESLTDCLTQHAEAMAASINDAPLREQMREHLEAAAAHQAEAERIQAQIERQDRPRMVCNG